jgi:hypothetical protein
MSYWIVKLLNPVRTFFPSPATAKATSFVGHPPYPRRLLDPYEMAEANTKGAGAIWGEGKPGCSLPGPENPYILCQVMARAEAGRKPQTRTSCVRLWRQRGSCGQHSTGTGERY